MGILRVIMGGGIDRIGHATTGIPVGATIEYGMAGIEGTRNAEAGPRGVGDVYVDLFHRVDGAARRATFHVFVLLKIGSSLLGERIQDGVVGR